MIQPWKRKRLTLMPAVVLAALSALVAVPTLSSSHLYAAGPQSYTTVTVHAGDSLWSLAATRAREGVDIQDSIDAIVSTNHLGGSTIHPGQRLKIPH